MLHSLVLVLADVLATEPQRPVLVTLCRSVRDGYAPSALWRQIETGVLAALAAQYGPLDVRFDANLLGGPLGWDHHARPLD